MQINFRSFAAGIRIVTLPFVPSRDLCGAGTYPTTKAVVPANNLFLVPVDCPYSRILIACTKTCGCLRSCCVLI
jgi:hypothetical protein